MKTGSLAWYAEAKNLALEEVVKFVPPADPKRMRLFHDLYLVNMLALVDLASEIFGDEVRTGWLEALEGVGGLGAENNNSYLRELRNGAVHRSLDITAAGIVIEGVVCAVSPQEVWNRTGLAGPFKAFSPLLRNVFAICEDTIAAVIGPMVREANHESVIPSEEEFERTFHDAIDGAPHMPDWAKDMARLHVSYAHFSEAHAYQLRQCEDLMCRGAPSDLSIRIEL